MYIRNQRRENNSSSYRYMDIRKKEEQRRNERWGRVSNGCE
jgi:hypothetical protein